MSISGSQEVKTATLEVIADAGDTEIATLDAQEDREIVGYDFTLIPGEGSPDFGTVEGKLRVGSDQFAETSGTSFDEDSQDNLSFMARHQAVVMDDDTNNKAAKSNPSNGYWFGHGSGIEWNEDATLTLECTAGAEAGTASVEVQYREL